MKRNILMRKSVNIGNTICLENEKEKGADNRILEIPEYKENLEFEVLESFSEKIKGFIESNNYQKVIEFTEKQLYFLNLISVWSSMPLFTPSPAASKILSISGGLG